MAKKLTIVVAAIKKLAIVVVPILAFLVALRIDATVGWHWLSFLKWPAFVFIGLYLLFLLSLFGMAALGAIAGVAIGTPLGLLTLAKNSVEAWKKARNEPSNDFGVGYWQGFFTATALLVILCALIYFF